MCITCSRCNKTVYETIKSKVDNKEICYACIVEEETKQNHAETMFIEAAKALERQKENSNHIDWSAGDIIKITAWVEFDGSLITNFEQRHKHGYTIKTV